MRERRRGRHALERRAAKRRGTPFGQHDHVPSAARVRARAPAADSREVPSRGGTVPNKNTGRSGSASAFISAAVGGCRSPALVSRRAPIMMPNRWKSAAGAKSEKSETNKSKRRNKWRGACQRRARRRASSQASPRWRRCAVARHVTAMGQPNTTHLNEGVTFARSRHHRGGARIASRGSQAQKSAPAIEVRAPSRALPRRFPSRARTVRTSARRLAGACRPPTATPRLGPAFGSRGLRAGLPACATTNTPV